MTKLKFYLLRTRHQIDYNLIDALSEQIPYDLILHTSIRQRTIRYRRLTLRNVQDIPQEQQTIIDTIALLNVQLGIPLDDPFDVIHHRLSASTIGERLLAGDQQSIQFEDCVSAYVGPGNRFDRQKAFDGNGQIDQDFDGGIDDFARVVDLGVIFDVDQQRDQIFLDVLSETDGSAERAQSLILDR